MDYTIVYKKVKRITLRVMPDGTVSVTAPKHTGKRVLDAFVADKEAWILAQQQKRLEQEQYRSENGLVNDYRHGGNVVFLGKGYPLQVHVQGAAELHWQGDGFLAEGCETEEQVRKLVEKFYRSQLEECIIPAVNREARSRFHENDLPDPEIIIRKMGASWGLCYYNENRIKLNLWLAMATKPCIRQVLLHEYVHFFHPNHSADFYSLLKQVEPDYEELRKQLNRQINLRGL